MGISAGGVIEEWGPPRHALAEVMKQVRGFAPRLFDEDYVVDIAFRSWHVHRESEFTGVQADMVGRKQRRFIVWHSVPLGLVQETLCRAYGCNAVVRWLDEVIPPDET